MLIDGLTVEELIKRETESRETMFWGRKSTVTPALVDEVHGDGLQVVWLSSINTRPNYYLLRIDSSVVLDDDESLPDKDKTEYGTVLEMLLQLIEEQYGDIYRYAEGAGCMYYDPDDDGIEPFEYSFPMLNWGGGSWGLIANFKTGETECF